MKMILICPSPRPGLELLSKSAPLAAVPLLGQSLIEYWLSDLAGAGVRDVLLLAADRPAAIAALCDSGARWGISVSVEEESRELTPADALLKYERLFAPGPDRWRLAVLEHFPNCPQLPLFASYAAFFAALQSWMPRARTPDRVGVHEVRPGVWAGLNTRVSPQAEVHAPCWLGRNVLIAPRVVVGPRAIIEDGVVIQDAAEIHYSYVAPGTLVGPHIELSHSLALGSTVVDWKTGSAVQVPDEFLLCSLRHSQAAHTAPALALQAEAETEARQNFALLFLKQVLLGKERLR